MRWIKPTERASVREGAHGPIVIAGDRSFSISQSAAWDISSRMEQIRKDDPRIRCVGFYGSIFEDVEGEQARICEVRDGFRFEHFYPNYPLGVRWGDNASGTDIGESLLEIQKYLRPSKLILISDGGCRNPRRTKRIADSLTFPVDCIYYEQYLQNFYADIPQEYVKRCLATANEALMRYIARRGQCFRTTLYGLDQVLPRCIPPKPQGVERIRHVHIHDGGTEIIDHRQAHRGARLTPVITRVRGGGR